MFEFTLRQILVSLPGISLIIDYIVTQQTDAPDTNGRTRYVGEETSGEDQHFAPIGQGRGRWQGQEEQGQGQGQGGPTTA